MTCLGDVHRENQWYPEAVQRFSDSISTNPLDPWPRKGLADCYEKLNDYIGLRTVYEEAVKAIPADYSFKILLGKYYHTYVNFDENARDSLLKAVEQCPFKEDL